MLLRETLAFSCQLPSGWLKAVAPLNMLLMSVTADVLQLLISPLKAVAPENI